MTRAQFMADFLVALAPKLYAPHIYRRRALDGASDLAADAFDALERRLAVDEGKVALAERDALTEAWEQARIHAEFEACGGKGYCTCTTCVLRANHGECRCEHCERAKSGREMVEQARNAALYLRGRSDEAKASEAEIAALRGFVEWVRQLFDGFDPQARRWAGARLEELDAELAKGRKP